MTDRWTVASYEQIPAMETSPEGEWIKYEDYYELLHKYNKLMTSEEFLNEELQELKKKYYTLLEGYNLLETRIQTLSYKAYPARNGSGE